MALNTTTEQAREALRREHGVELVTGAEEGCAAEQLRPGVYGFTNSPALASPLFVIRQHRNFEVHRLADGGTAVVGFVTPAESALLTRRQSDPVTVTVFPDSEGEATAIVSLPYDRVVQHRQYSVRNAVSITLQVAPASNHPAEARL